MSVNRCSWLIALLVLVALTGCHEPSAPPVFDSPAQPEAPSVERVRRLLRDAVPDVCGVGFESVPADRALQELGPRAFSAYEAILADRHSRGIEINMAFRMIYRTQTDRRQFIPILLKRMAPGAMLPDDPNGQFQLPGNWGIEQGRNSIRYSAAHLLGEIGDVRDTGALFPLLSEQDSAPDQDLHYERLRYEAANALAKIGGQRDLDSLNAWLMGESYKNDTPYRQHVRECRDKLDKRLKQSPIPRDLKD